MKLKIILPFILLIALAVYYFKGGVSEEALWGTWQNDDTSLEFKKDGTWISRPRHLPEELKIWGTYEFVGKKKLIMNYSNPPYPTYTEEHKVTAFTETELTLVAYVGEDEEGHEIEDVREFIKRGARAKRTDPI